MAWFGSLWALLLCGSRLFASLRTGRRLGLGRCLHESLEGVAAILTPHALCCVTHTNLLARQSFLASGGGVLRDRTAVDHHGFGALALASLLILNVDLLHLVMLLTVVHLLLHHLTLAHIHHLLPIALILLLHLLLLLLFKEKHLLDLLLGQLLVNHLLLGREVILLDLLATSLDLKLLVLPLTILILFVIILLLVHDICFFPVFFVIIVIVLMLLLLL